MTPLNDDEVLATHVAPSAMGEHLARAVQDGRIAYP